MYCVVFCVGRRAVDLHDLPSVHLPHIADLHCQRDAITDLIVGNSVKLLFKRRVGQAVAKGIVNCSQRCFLTLTIRLSIVDDTQIMSCLIISVSDIHPFLILDVIQAGRLNFPIIVSRENHTLGIGVNHITEVGLGGVVQQFGIPDIRCTSGRINLTGQNITQGLKACIAGMPNPHNGITCQLSLHQLFNLHNIGGVEHSNCRPAMRLGKGNGPLFRFGQCKNMRGTIRQWSGRVICTFTADASDVNHANISGTGIGQLQIFRGINLINLGTVVIDIFLHYIGNLIRGNLHNLGFLQHLQTGFVDCKMGTQTSFGRTDIFRVNGCFT